MRESFASKLSYANVTATLALFLALGGASYAASSLSANSVGTRQLRNGAVTDAKVRNGSLTGSKIRASTLGTVPNATAAGARVYFHSEGLPVGLSDLATRHIIQSMTLPAGTFLVTVKQVGQRGAAGGGEIDCYIYSGAQKVDTFYTILQVAGTSSPNTSAVPMVGTALIRLSAPTVISDQCDEFTNPGAIIADGTISAIQVGSVPTAAADAAAARTATAEPASAQAAQRAR